MNAEEFEALLRAELALRDQRIDARRFHPDQRTEADEMFVRAVKTAAGHGGLADTGKTLAKARRSRQRAEDQAFSQAG
jgi:hypothetical protein